MISKAHRDGIRDAYAGATALDAAVKCPYGVPSTDRTSYFQGFASELQRLNKVAREEEEALAELNNMYEAEHKAKMKKPVDYVEFVESMVLTTGQDRLVENTLGLVGEAGEVAEKIKKKLRDGNIDIQGLQKELGDVIFYWYALHGALGLDPEVTKSMNKDKLNSRKERGTLQGNGDER